jgi:hypothetical protein
MDYYPNRASVKNIAPVARAAMDSIIDALTRPLKPGEKKPGVKPLEKATRKITITADTIESAYERFNELFLEKRWSDGLPLIPPTQEAVKRMLAGTTRSPDEIVGAFPSPDGLAVIGTATLEKIAINSVMAGAKPEYFPVIVAAIEGLTDKAFSPHVFTSEGSFTLLITVNGPIAKRIDMNSGIGLLGHGWRANNTIGRAVRLSLINIGNLRPAEYDMALIGRPSSHTFYVLAENEDFNPWEPYQVSRGFRPKDSCVTVSTVGGPGPFGIKLFGGGTVVPWTTQGILNDIILDLAVDRAIFTGFKPGEGNATAQPRNHIIVLHPEMVDGLHRLGFTRQSLRDHIIDCTAIPYEQLSQNEIQGIKLMLTEKSEVFFGAGNIPDDRIPVFKKALRSGGKIPVIISPDDLTILVSGGLSGYSFGLSYLRGAHIVKLIR